MKKLFVFVLILNIFIVHSQSLDANWIGDKVKNFKSKARSSYNKGKSKVSKSYRSSRKKSSNYYNSSKNKIKKRTSNYYNSSKSKFKSSYNKVKKFSSNYYKNNKDKISNSYNSFRQKSSNAYNKNKQNISEKFGKSKAQALAIKKRFGYQGNQILKNMNAQYSHNMRTTVANFLVASKGNALKIYNKSKSKLDHINRFVRDPETKKKLVKATLIASAVALYTYNHKDDIQYAVAKSVFDTQVLYNGKKESIGSIFTERVVEKYPTLKGTKLAEDPASIYAYGITAIGKEDMLHSVKIIPSQDGKSRTIEEAFPMVNTYEDASNMLNLSSNTEKILLTQASDGKMGEYSQEFALAYSATGEHFVGR